MKYLLILFSALCVMSCASNKTYLHSNHVWTDNRDFDEKNKFFMIDNKFFYITEDDTVAYKLDSMKYDDEERETLQMYGKDLNYNYPFQAYLIKFVEPTEFYLYFNWNDSFNRVFYINEVRSNRKKYLTPYKIKD